MDAIEFDYNSVPSPAYILDEGLLFHNLEYISAIARDSGISIIPALKGFAFWKMFPLVSRYVPAAAASSLNEARLIHEEMGHSAHTYAPVFRGDEFEKLLACSSHITFNSASQAERFLPRIHAWNNSGSRHISWGVRVNPGYSPVQTDLYNPASEVSRLGMQKNEVDELLNSRLPEGLHVHALCESSAADTAELIKRVVDNWGGLLSRLSWLNLGGGHLMTRKGYDRELLVSSLKQLKAGFPHLDIYLEPGSAFAWETGVLRASVEDVVNRGGIDTAILDVSFTAHMPDCLEMPYQPRIRGAEIAGEENSAGGYRYRIGGNSCLAGDVMGDWIFPEPLNPGDTVIFEDMIHYTMVKTTMFNGVHHPDIGILDTGGNYRVVRHFTYGDYRDRLS